MERLQKGGLLVVEHATAPAGTQLADVLKRIRARPLNAPAMDPLSPYDPRDEDPEPEPSRVVIEYECPKSLWEPLSGHRDCENAPRRFIDGSFRSRIVMGLEDTKGRQRPAILAAVGAVALELVPKGPNRFELSRAHYDIGTRLIFLANGLNPRDVEVIRRAMAAINIDVVASETGKLSSDFDEARRRTLEFVRREMLRLETALLSREPSVPTVVDGLLDQRIETFPSHNLPAVGVVKRQLQTYLHHAGRHLIYRLKPGERTPAVLLDTTRGEYVTFYLRLCNSDGALPHAGVVRVMISREYFEDHCSQSFGYLSGLGHWICRVRCRRTSYERAHVSLEPIVHAEEHLRALLPDIDQRVGAIHRALSLYAPNAEEVA